MRKRSLKRMSWISNTPLFTIISKHESEFVARDFCCNATSSPFLVLGKSERAIKSRLLQLCSQQKANEKKKNCAIVKSKAAPLQPPDTKSRNIVSTMPPSEPNSLCAPSQPTDARVNFVLQAVSAEALSQVQPAATTTPLQLQWNKADKAAAPAMFSVVKSQNDSGHKDPALNESPDTKPLVALTPKPHQNVTLPLIRSKTGRIILPSSLKPSKFRLHAFIVCIVFYCIYPDTFFFFVCFFYFPAKLARASIPSPF